MTVDLNTCVPGQPLRLHDKRIVKYDYKMSESNEGYCHVIDNATYTNSGKFWYAIGRKSSLDVAEILPMEDELDVVEILPLETIKPTKSDKYPSVAWWESCPWITDRKPTEEDGDSLNQVMMKVEGQKGTKATLCFIRWEYVRSDQAWIHCLNWNHPKQTPREKATELISDHEDGWTPTPKEWDIIRKGLEPS